MFEFFRKVITFFDDNNIPYMLSGSMAMIAYSHIRYTKDFDFIVLLKPSDALLLSENFSEGYYCDEESIREAIKAGSLFNIIDHKSNYKADFIVLTDDEFERKKFERRILADSMGLKVYIITPEDLLISKLAWIQEFQSALQAQDITWLSEIQNLDWSYIWSWVDKLKLNTFGLIQK